MNGAHVEAHVLELLNDVVESVLVLGEDQEPLVAVSEEALLFEQAPELRELRLGVCVFNGLGRLREAIEFLNLLLNLIGIACQRDRIKQALQSLPLGVLKFFHLRWIRDVWWCFSRQRLGMLKGVP